MAFRLATLGRCNLEDGSGNVINVPTQSLLLAAYLFDVGRPVQRRDVANFLWPGNAEVALTNLRSTLRRFQRATQGAPSPLISIDPTSVCLNRTLVSCDLDVMALPTPAERLEAACRAVAMLFLPLSGAGKTPFDTWVRDVRLRLLGTLRSLFMQGASSEELKTDITSELRRAAVLLLEADPHDHDVRRFLASGLASLRPPPLPAVVASSEKVEQTPLVAGKLTAHPRIALLPPLTSKEANKDGSIANALIEDLTIGLCSSRTVSVVAPYTSERIQASKDKAAVLEKHNVVYALDSRRTDSHLFLQLIFTPTEEIIWAERFELSPISIAAHRVEIASAVQGAVMSQIGQHQNAFGDFASRPEAYFLYLKGLQSLSSINLPSIRRARKYFKDALDHGNDFPEALAGMSRTLSLEWVLTARGDTELLTKAEGFASTAIRASESSASGFKELGVSRMFMGRIDESLDALLQAENLSPQYADVLCSLSDSLIHGSDPASAMIKIRQAIALNPMAPDLYYWVAAGASYFLHDFELALDYLNRMRHKRPAARLTAACHGMLGDIDKARVFRAKVFEDNPSFDLERWLAVLPHKEPWQTELYRKGLEKAGF